MLKFEMVKIRSQIESPYLPETHFITAFVRGLREDIKHLVLAKYLASLLDAFTQSKHMKPALDYQAKRSRFDFQMNPLSLTTQPKPTTFKQKGAEMRPVNNTVRNTLIEQRRYLGLCFKCGEKYYPVHQCKVNVHMLLGTCDMEMPCHDEEEVLAVGNGASEIADLEAEEAIVSTCATSSNPRLSTMKFKGKIGNRDVYALLDSGSTHSFIHPEVLTGVNCTLSQTIPMVVMMANGDKLVTYTKCEGLTYSLQGYPFTDNLRVLNIQGYDMILSIDWLTQYRPMQVDWLEKWISFEKKGSTC